MEPLTPNTSAILSMLSAHLGGDNNNNNQSIYDENSFNPFDINAFNTYNPSPPIDKNKNVPASLPPSAFFPIPGRDTPEDTPPSTHEASQSPEKILSTDTQPKVKKSTSDGSGDSEVESRLGGGRRVSVNHKRKAGLGNQKNKHVEEEEDDEEDDSDEGDEHEDKRVHQNAKTSGAKKGGRKSVGEDGKGPKENKAARRKEQNRAAQKAFRERREAKVKDLEEKVAELERKSYGTSVENENLRGILKRLQEENVALRQNAFTFSMPVNGTSQTGNSTGTSTPIVGGPQRQQSKPLSPPISNDDVLHSIYDVPPVPQRKVSSAVGESPDSLHSVASGSGSLTDANGQYRSPPSLFQGSANAFDTALPGNMRPAMATSNSGTSNSTHDSASRSNSGLSPASTSSNGRTELDALWASFLQQGAPQKDQYPAWNANAPNMMGALDVPTNGISFADPNAKVASQGNTNNWDKSAFRDTSAPAPQSTQNAFQQPQQRAVQPQAPTQSADPWSSMMDNSMDDFLASLTGANVGVENDLGTNDEDFNAQLQQILGSNNASPSNAFSLPGMNPFSPTNYLNMSPSPLVSASVSNEPSPQTASGSSVSASASPESIIGLNDSSRADSLICERPVKGVKPEPEHLYVVDESGKVIKPSELWVRMGMQHESNLEHLLIDDLCDMMRSKATCKDGKAVIQAHDAENLFKYKSNDPQHVARLSRLEQRAGIAPGAFTQPQ